MSDNEKLINQEILKVCEEILPRTTMRNNQELKKTVKVGKGLFGWTRVSRTKNKSFC